MQMRHRHWLVAALAAGALAAGPAGAQVAGQTTIAATVEQTPLGVSVTEAQVVALGWSARKGIIGKDVYNDAGQKIGKIADLIVAPDSAVSYAIVGVGPFVGITHHDVAIPVRQFDLQAGRFVLAGASKDALKALPRFEYAPSK